MSVVFVFLRSYFIEPYCRAWYFLCWIGFSLCPLWKRRKGKENVKSSFIDFTRNQLLLSLALRNQSKKKRAKKKKRPISFRLRVASPKTSLRVPCAKKRVLLLPSPRRRMIFPKVHSMTNNTLVALKTELCSTHVGQLHLYGRSDHCQVGTGDVYYSNQRVSNRTTQLRSHSSSSQRTA